MDQHEVDDSIVRILNKIGLNVDPEKFSQEADEVGAAVIVAALAHVTDTDPDELDLYDTEYDTYQMTVAAYGLRKATSFMVGTLKESLAEHAFERLLRLVMEN